MRLAAGNPMATALMVILVFEAVVFGLAIPGMVVVSRQPLLVAVALCGAALLLALAAVSTLGKGPGYPLGWLTQLAGLALGLATPYMFVMGGIFAALWITAFALGRRLERAR